ncbi:methyltransferase family protein [Sorangium sp. KYC3313]|uniref:methyltransferase family protein n=1 Tax=Sorangium sp. KYC3313 TaxID=3449740 RepID=UPI003F887E0E
MVGEALAEDEDSNRQAVTSSEDAGTRRLVLGAHLLAWWMPLAEVAIRETPASVARTAVGLGCIVAGGALRIVAVKTLGRFFTAHVSIAQDHAVCDRGPYRFIRHPSYVGLLFLNAGPSIAAGTWFALAATVAATLVANFYRVRVEETALVSKLGEAYRAYQARTPRWMPFGRTGR